MLKRFSLLLLFALALSACQNEKISPLANDNVIINSQSENQAPSVAPSNMADKNVNLNPDKKQAATAAINTNMGPIVVKLFPDKAPLTVANFIGLSNGSRDWKDPRTGKKTNQPLYRNLIFHRVIKGFMIQTGDPLGTGRGGPGYSFKDEFDTDLVFDKAGVLAMANSGPNTNGSQFFITLAPTPWLNGKHTIFGQVIKGMDIVEKIGQVEVDQQDKPLQDVIIKSIDVTP